MRVSEPLVCHHCWPTRPNWYEACPHAKEVIDRVYVGRPVSALENELDSRSDECFELRQDVKRLEGEANELRAQLARTTSGVAALVDAARGAVKSIEWHSERGCGLAIDEDAFLALCAALKGDQRKPTGKVAALRKALSQCLERAERASSSEAEMALEGIASVARAALGALR